MHNIKEDIKKDINIINAFNITVNWLIKKAWLIFKILIAYIIIFWCIPIAINGSIWAQGGCEAHGNLLSFWIILPHIPLFGVIIFLIGLAMDDYAEKKIKGAIK